MCPESALRARAARSACALLLAAAFVAPRVLAQCSTAFLYTGSLQFGQALDISGDRLIVGDFSVGFGGSAHVMRNTAFGWKLETSIFSPTPEANGRFGETVAVFGDWAAVGASGELGAAGAVHLFHRECDARGSCEWTWFARLQPAPAAANDRFGSSVALEGGRLLVGAPASDVAGPDAGALFVFEESGGAWTQVQTLTAGAGAMSNAGVGACVALGGDLAVAGSKGSNVAWLFEHEPGGYGAPRALEVLGSGNLGAAVATDGERVLLGAPGSNITAIKSGAAHVFERTGAGAGSWTMTATFTPTGPSVFASFGTAVALDGATAVIGAPGSGAGLGALTLMHLEASGWTLSTTFVTPPGPTSQGLGVAAALDGDTLGAGARITLGPPGVVFLFGGVAPWPALGGGISGSFGVPVLTVKGSLCGDDTLSFEISHAKPKAPALFVIGFSATPQPWKGGVLWPHPDLVLPRLLSTAGKATLTLHVPAGQPMGVPVVAQAWIADPAGPEDLAATSAYIGTTP